MLQSSLSGVREDAKSGATRLIAGKMVPWGTVMI
jgi:hypothetical protein